MMALWPEACPALASISGGMAVVMSGKYCVILLMARATRASHSEFTSFASAPTEDGLALNDDAAAVDFFEGGVSSLTEALTLAFFAAGSSTSAGIPATGLRGLGGMMSLEGRR